MERVDDNTLKLTLTAGGVANLIYDISSIQNPYSQVTNNVISVKHYPACNMNTQTACSANCEFTLTDLYTVPAVSVLPKPASTILNSA